MRPLSGLPMAALMLMASGCFGGSDDGGDEVAGNPPPPFQPPAQAVAAAGIWTGELTAAGGTALRFRGLVSGSGEFRLVLYDQSQQIAGTFTNYGPDGIVAEHAEWDIEVWTDITLRGSLAERESMTGEFETNFAPVAAGTFTFTYDELYERDSSLALVAGTYTTASESMAIDSQGGLFYQSSDSDCVGNGSIEPINPDFNMYRVAIEVANCTREEDYRNGSMYRGLAYIGDSGSGAMNDTLQLAASSGGANCGLVCFISWNLMARK